MADDAEESLYEVLHGILHLFPQTIDFRRRTSDALPEIVDTLTRVAIVINLLSLHQYGGRLGPGRGNDLVEQVVAASFQTFGGFDPHPDAFDKAAMLLHGIVAGHPFGDANKRTGFLVAMYYLERVEIQPRRQLPRLEVVELCRQVSAGEVRDIDAIAQRLRCLWG